MEAKDVRIGNLYDHNGTHEKITPNVICELWDAKRAWCKPIPITAEEIEKLGFKFINEPNRYGWYKDVLNREFCWCHSEFISIEFKRGQNDEYTNTLLDINCKFVHQLQNLYFALTGEDLQYTQAGGV
jgi:hypothetical protein